MMKKIISLAIILTIAFQCKAQFVNSIGLTAGVSLGNQKFFFKDPVAISKKNTRLVLTLASSLNFSAMITRVG